MIARRVLAVVAVVGVLAAACGGSNEADEPSEPAVPSTVASDSQQDVAVDDSPVDTATEPEPEPESEPEPTIADTEPEPEPATRTVEHALGVSEIPANPQRIAALSEEFLLADLLSLGVTPIVSTSNDAEVFPGIDPALTEGIEIVFTPSFNLEELAAIEPDLILGYPGIFNVVPGGYDVVSDIAPTVAVGTAEMDPFERLAATAEVLGLDADLDERVA
ncbi:MAG: ABC transporter substrate-binding protein, partial [Actinomycetota bacterium]